MLAFARSLDDSRPITVACDKIDREKVLDLVDVIGVNYCYDQIDALHEKYPDKPMIMTECVASGTKRGWYDDVDDKKAARPAWDNDTGDYFRNKQRTYSFLAERPFIAGSYQWTAFEHRGEAVWPRLCSISGAIDLYLQKKDAFYQNKAYWTDEPLIHLLPHWNFRGREGMPIHVVAYTNCPQVVLTVNGKKYEPVSVSRYSKAEWDIPYEPGYIRAEGVFGGKTLCSCERHTTGEPVALALSLDTADVTANGKDYAIFTCYAVDKDGNRVPDATPLVTFSASGCAKVFSTGSDNADHEPLFSPTRRMYSGAISVAVSVSDNGKPLRLSATDVNGSLASAYFTADLTEKE